MRMVVNHLTRMEAGYICVAGVEWETGAHVRPVLAGQRLGADLLLSRGGLFELGAIIELGPTVPVGRPPEVEDHQFDPAQARRLGRMRGDDFWSMLEMCARETLTDIFGEDLREEQRHCVTDVGFGRASLGCLVPAAPPRLHINSMGRVRMRVSDGHFYPELSVTDLRLVEADQKTPRERTVRMLQKKIAAGVGLILGVGLTRPWRRDRESPARHWLQVTGIFPRDDPLWV